MVLGLCHRSSTSKLHRKFTENSPERLLEHIEVTCPPAGPNMYGTLQEAQLRAEGFWASAHVKEGGCPDCYGSNFDAVSEIVVDGLRLVGGIEPDIQGDGYEIRVEDCHFTLCIERGIMGIIILRNSRLHSGA